MDQKYDMRIPCKICSRLTFSVGTRLCDTCYEANRGLNWLLSFQEGKDYIKNKVEEYNKDNHID